MIVKALKLRPLYTALVLAGRDPALREVLDSAPSRSATRSCRCCATG